MNELKNSTKIEQMCYNYLAHNDKVWDSRTYQTESSKLNTIKAAVLKSGFRGQDFYAELKRQGYKPYTIKMLVQRAASVYEYGQTLGIVEKFNNPFRDLLRSSPQLFRNAYKAERLKIDYDEAKRRIATIEHKDVRDFCMQLLQTGLRIHEAYIVNYETQSVIGKGDKERFTVFEWTADRAMPSQHMIRTELKKIGLKPHSLRKLLATKLSRDSSFSHQDIMAVMGWSSIETASKYFQPLKEAELKQKMKGIV